MGKRSAFGSVRVLPSARVQARYTGPDGATHTAGTTFATKTDARGWLATEQALLVQGKWTPPAVRLAVHVAEVASTPTLTEYAATWMSGRSVKPGTEQHYRNLLDNVILPTLGGHPINTISPVMVRAWHAKVATGPTMKAHAYSLLKTILSTAVKDDLLPSNPCRIDKAGSHPRQKRIKPATLAELKVITEQAPDKYRLMVLLASWAGLRFGEITELRRKDFTPDGMSVEITRGVTRVGGTYVVGRPKSDAGVRTVAIPPHPAPMVVDHLTRHTGPQQDALLFASRSGGHLAPSTVDKWFYPARKKAGRPDLRWHDLRHTGATLAAATGATLKELMSRLGHSTPDAALIYQHAAQDRDRAIADALSELAAGDVVPLRKHA